MGTKDPNLPIIAPNPDDTPGLYNSFKLAGTWSPGTCRFDSPPKRLTGWDLQAPSGGAGGWTIPHKQPPIKFTMKIKIWKGDGPDGEDVNDYPAWEAFKKIFLTPIKKNSKKALAIYHPQLAGLLPPVTDVVIEGWTDVAPDPEGGGTATIDFIEYRPFITQPVKPLIGTTTAKNDPNADVKAALDLATKENQDPGTLTPAQRHAIGLDP